MQITEKKLELSRQQIWESTTNSSRKVDGVRIAHAEGPICRIEAINFLRSDREVGSYKFAEGATVCEGAGNREREEEPDPFRTAFEVDRDRILHSKAFRRLNGKTQVFIFPNDHQRTRMTHALEVSQVARSISNYLGLNTALVEAIALGHDCGHGPGGHICEDVLSEFLRAASSPEKEFDHAPWGAEVILKGKNLTEETLDGIANHSWSRPSPKTPEGVVVSWADRFAYLTHDLEDAISAGIISSSELPKLVIDRLGDTHSKQLNTLITKLVQTVSNSGIIGLDEDTEEALAEFRRFNTEKIYRRKESIDDAEKVKELLRKLVRYFIDNPGLIPPSSYDLGKGNVYSAVKYVSKMTDRFAIDCAKQLLGIRDEEIPLGMFKGI